MAEQISLLMSAEETAKLLGISSRHLRRLAERGEFPAPVRLGKRVKWSRNGIYEWVNNGCCAVASKAKCDA